MILRIWHGWTEPADADAYERLLEEELLPRFAQRDIEGYRGFELGRRARGDEVEFVTLMRFDSWEAVEEFAGEDYRRAHVPSEARELLSRFDSEARHYERRTERTY